MNSLKIAAALSLALAAAPLAASAQTAPTPTPIAITKCQVQQYQGLEGRRFWYPWAYSRYDSIYTDGVEISYVNKTPLPASRVVFAVNYRGDVEHVVDAGTFSPGVSIDHTFGQFTGLAFLGVRPNSCRVAAVRFTDGTAWRAVPMPH
jgi:hypothetical protein